MATTLSGVTAKKRPEPSAEGVAAVELVRMAREKGLSLTGPDGRAYVEQGKAHAALVMDGDQAIAWAEYGTPVELPTLHHRKEYDATKTADPDYRITCVFVDKRYRRRRVTELAIRAQRAEELRHGEDGRACMRPVNTSRGQQPRREKRPSWPQGLAPAVRVCCSNR